jgi:hypothetical protein
MQHYERPAEDDRMMRRTIANAIEVLREFAGFKADEPVQRNCSSHSG